MADIQFVVRKRSSKNTNFWSIFYEFDNGKITSIVPGKTSSADALVVPYNSVKDILSGFKNQNDYRVKFNEVLGALDIVKYSETIESLNKQLWKTWLSAREYEGNPVSSLRLILFNDIGVLRIEADRVWTTSIKESMEKETLIYDSLSIYIADEQDPHVVFGMLQISLNELIERGYYEIRLWAFMDHAIVQNILYRGQRVQMNMPPVADSMCFFRASAYYTFSGVVEAQTTISRYGKGKHISIYAEENKLWAKSHYERGSAIDLIVGDLPLVILSKDDPDYFHSFAELPALMMRQEHPFLISDNWPYSTSPYVLYKANSLDIGVSCGNPN